MAVHHSLLNGSDAFLCQERSADKTDTQRFFDDLSAIDAILEDGRRNETEYNRVRIAILDSGIDMKHSEVKRLNQEQWPRVTYFDFTGESFDSSNKVSVEALEGAVDLVGHGTHIAVTVLKIAKWAEIYVARVVDKDGNLNPECIARALQHSLHVWKVDIISMSFGFSEVQRQCFKELKAAISNGIMIFAAASNQGASGVTTKQSWPARETLVFGAYSADLLGNDSRFNPNEDIGDGFSHFKFLGENVESAWPLSLLKAEDWNSRGLRESNDYTRQMTGTSVAAPIGAATAALFIEFVQQYKGDDDQLEALIKSPIGMKLVFTFVGIHRKHTDILRYVLPWHLIKVNASLFQRSDVSQHIQIARIAKDALAVVNSALSIQRLSPEVKKQEHVHELVTGAQVLKRKSELNKESFRAEKKSIRDSTNEALKYGALYSVGIVGLTAGASFFMGPLGLVFGSCGMAKMFQYIWDQLKSQRNDAGNLLSATAEEEATLLRQFQDIAQAVSEDVAVTIPARLFIKDVSKTVARAEVLRQSNLLLLRESIGVNIRETKNTATSTQLEEMKTTTGEIDIPMMLQAPAPSHMQLDTALRKAVSEIKTSNETLTAEIALLNNWIQNFGSWSITRPKLPPPTEIRFGYILRNDVQNIQWYNKWEQLDHAATFPAVGRFLVQLTSTSQAFKTEAENHKYLGELCVRTQQNIEDLRKLVDTDLPKLEQTVRDFETQRDSNFRTQYEGQESWIKWFLKWLDLGAYIFKLFRG